MKVFIAYAVLSIRTGRYFKGTDAGMYKSAGGLGQTGINLFLQGGSRMSINIRARQDMSFLFSGLGGGAANVASSNFLGEYASIKNGSYAKLMKAYYAKDSSDSVKAVAKDTNKNKEVTSKEVKAYTKVQSATDALKESADAMLVKGSKSVFEKKDITTTDENGVETTAKGYDTEGIYKAVKGFVTSYNQVINSLDDVSNNSITNRATSMVNHSIANLRMLNKIGISINADSTLSLDKDTFMKSDMTKVQSLFQGNGSYGYQVSSQASMMNFAADTAASKASTYTGRGTYSNFNTGNLFSGYF